MRISGNEVQKQLHQMIAFIEQEASEKVEEIDTKTEEEFNVESSVWCDSSVQTLSTIMTRKRSRWKCSARFSDQTYIPRSSEVSQGKDDHLRNVLSDARANLCKISEDEGRYPSIIKGLILQALLRLLEKNVTLKCRHKDKELVSKLLPDCLEELYKSGGAPQRLAVSIFHLTFTKLPLIYVTIDEEYLDKDCAGGVEMTAKVGKIKVCSTLESRLDLIAGQVIPQLRTTLFGPNPSRKFFD
uniref:Vacuolar protein sorting-associated protein 51 homolog n=1 Tax=Ditylenchus dipsaci TaxID=166011 RepID=A0A915DH33_9BILA